MILVSKFCSVSGLKLIIKNTSFKMTNSIFFQKKMLMAMLVVLVQISHLPMVSMLVTLTKEKSWVTVGFFQLCRRWLEYQEGNYGFEVLFGAQTKFLSP